MIGNFSLEMATTAARKHALFAQMWLFCDFLILFAFFNVGEVRNSWIGVRAAELNTEN